MAYERLEDVLQKLHRLRECTRDLVRDARHREADTMTAQLMQRFDEHDYEMQLLLQHAAENAPDSARETWLQYADTRPIERAIEALANTVHNQEQASSGGQVIRQALDIDQQLLAFVRTLREQSAAPSVSQFLQEVLEMEEQVSRLKSRNTIEREDLSDF
jgi:G3E family GTPase